MLDHSLASRPHSKCDRPRPRNGSVAMYGPYLYYTEFNDPIALDRAFRDYFLARRPVSIDRRGRKYPETLVREIAQVASALYKESRRYTDQRKVSWRDTILAGPLAYLANELGRDDDYAGHQDAVKRYGDYYKRIKAELDALPASSVYPGNADAWHEMGRLAIRLGVAKDNPIEPASVVASVAHGLKELPNTLATTAEVVSRAALRPLREIGDELTGLLKSIALPVAIGGGAIVGLVLLTRSRSDKRERAS